MDWFVLNKTETQFYKLRICVKSIIAVDEVHSSAVLSLLVFFIVKSQLELVRVWREASRHQPRRHSSRWGLTQAERLFCSLGKSRTKSRASGSRTSLLNTITILRDRVVCQHCSAIARREQDAPYPKQPWKSCGLPRPYGGSDYGKDRLPRFVYRWMSPLASKKGPPLAVLVPSDNGSRKPAGPYGGKETLLIRSMLK